MDFRQLRYFVTIIEEGSLSRAAVALRIAQPALSLHVRKLEAELGSKLLLRSSRGVVPTESGVILARRAKTIIEQVSQTQEEIRGHESDPSGEVRLGLPGTISQILAVPLITAVRAHYPKIKLRISEAMSGFVLEWMRMGRVDLAVLYDEMESMSIQAKCVLEEELVAFGPASAEAARSVDANASMSFCEILGLPLILPGKGHALREQLERTAKTDQLEVRTVMDIDSYSNIKRLVMEGFGYSVLPRNAILEDEVRGKVAIWRIRDPVLRRKICLYSAGDRPATNAVAAVRDLAHETLLQLAADGTWVGARAVEG